MLAVMHALLRMCHHRRRRQRDQRGKLQRHRHQRRSPLTQRCRPPEGCKGGMRRGLGGATPPTCCCMCPWGGGRPPLLRALRCTHPPGSGSIKPYPERHMSYRHRHASPERHRHRITHDPLPLTHDPHIAPQTEWRMRHIEPACVCTRGRPTLHGHHAGPASAAVTV